MAREHLQVRVGATGLANSIRREAQRAEAQLARQPIRLNLDTKGFRQPLGRITHDVSEFNKSMDASVARVLAFGAAMAVMNAVSNSMKAMVQGAIKVEKALKDVNVILNLNNSQLGEFGDKLFDVARKTSQSFDTVSEAAVEFARQGLGAEETLKRINDAMILSRLSGLKATESVSSLTAAVNSYAKVGVTTTQVINRLANVDAAFAVSSADLANAIQRAGASAQGAKVKFNELLAVVTSVQQQTARGGAVIGNAFKSIFTRLQRSGVRSTLEEIGVATENTNGSLRSGLQVLKDYAKVYTTLTDQQKAYTDQQIAGLFQINNLKALLADLTSEYSIYDKALRTADSSTNQAIQRNEELNKTLGSLLLRTGASIDELAAKLGELGATEGISKLVNMVKGVADFLNDLLGTGENEGNSFAKNLVRGIGGFLTGPGLVIVGAALAKIFGQVSKFGVSAFKEILGLNVETKRQESLQKAIGATLSQNEKLYAQIMGLAGNTAQQEQVLLNYIKQETKERLAQEAIMKRIASSTAFIGVGAGEQGFVPAGRRGARKVGKKTLGMASGFVPNFRRNPAQSAEYMGMVSGGYSKKALRNPKIKKTKIHNGKGQSFWAQTNGAENIKTFSNLSGKKATMVVPEKQSDAYKGFSKKLKKRMAANGFIPNFAKMPRNFLGTKAGDIRKDGANRISTKEFDATNLVSMLVPDAGGAHMVKGGVTMPEGHIQRVKFMKVGPNKDPRGRVKRGLDKIARNQLNQGSKIFANLLDRNIPKGPMAPFAPSEVGTTAGRIFEKGVGSVLKSPSFGLDTATFDFIGGDRGKGGVFDWKTQLADAKSSNTPSNRTSMAKKTIEFVMKGAKGWRQQYKGDKDQASVSKIQRDVEKEVSKTRVGAEGAKGRRVGAVGARRFGWRASGGYVPNFFDILGGTSNMGVDHLGGASGPQSFKAPMSRMVSETGSMQGKNLWRALDALGVGNISKQYSLTSHSQNDFDKFVKTDSTAKKYAKALNVQSGKLGSHKGDFFEMYNAKQKFGKDWKSGLSHADLPFDTKNPTGRPGVGESKAFDIMKGKSAAGQQANVLTKSLFSDSDRGLFKSISAKLAVGAGDSSRISIPNQLASEMRAAGYEASGNQASKSEVKKFAKSSMLGWRKTYNERKFQRAILRDAPMFKGELKLPATVPFSGRNFKGRLAARRGLRGMGASGGYLPNFARGAGRPQSLSSYVKKEMVGRKFGDLNKMVSSSWQSRVVSGQGLSMAGETSFKNGLFSSIAGTFKGGMVPIGSNPTITAENWAKVPRAKKIQLQKKWKELNLGAPKSAQPVYNTDEQFYGDMLARRGNHAGGFAPNFALRTSPMKPPAYVMKMAEKIKAAGGRAQVIGGAPRDHLLGLGKTGKPKDWDVEVFGLQEKALRSMLGKNVSEVGKDFGVFKVNHRGTDYDFSMPRAETSTGRGHRDFKVKKDPFMSELEAAKRRDLTVNAISYDPLTKKFSDHGLGGMKDLGAKIMRPTSAKFMEDPLRVMRAMQFAGRFGFSGDAKLIEYSKAISGKFNALPKERVRDEWYKWATKSKEPSKGLDFLRKSGWMKHFPELGRLSGVKQSPKWHPEGNVFEHTKMVVDQMVKRKAWKGWSPDERWKSMQTALTHDFGKFGTTIRTPKGLTSAGHATKSIGDAEAFFQKIMSKGEAKSLIKEIGPDIGGHMYHTNLPVGNKAIGRMKRKGMNLERSIAMAKSDVLGRGPQPAGARGIKEVRQFEGQVKKMGVTRAAVKRLVTGNDLKKAGLMEQGPGMKPILNALEDAQLSGQFSTTAGGLKYAKGHLGLAGGYVPNFGYMGKGIRQAINREQTVSGQKAVVERSKFLDGGVGVYNKAQQKKYGSLDRTIQRDHLGQGQRKSTLGETGSGRERYAAGGNVPNFAGARGGSMPRSFGLQSGKTDRGLAADAHNAEVFKALKKRSRGSGMGKQEIADKAVRAYVKGGVPARVAADAATSLISGQAAGLPMPAFLLDMGFMHAKGLAMMGKNILTGKKLTTGLATHYESQLTARSPLVGGASTFARGYVPNFSPRWKRQKKMGRKKQGEGVLLKDKQREKQIHANIYANSVGGMQKVQTLSERFHLDKIDDVFQGFFSGGYVPNFADAKGIQEQIRQKKEALLNAERRGDAPSVKQLKGEIQALIQQGKSNKNTRSSGSDGGVTKGKAPVKSQVDLQYVDPDVKEDRKKRSLAKRARRRVRALRLRMLRKLRGATKTVGGTVGTAKQMGATGVKTAVDFLGDTRKGAGALTGKALKKVTDLKGNLNAAVSKGAQGVSDYRARQKELKLLKKAAAGERKRVADLDKAAKKAARIQAAREKKAQDKKAKRQLRADKDWRSWRKSKAGTYKRKKFIKRMTKPIKEWRRESAENKKNKADRNAARKAQIVEQKNIDLEQKRADEKAALSKKERNKAERAAGTTRRKQRRERASRVRSYKRKKFMKASLRTGLGAGGRIIAGSAMLATGAGTSVVGGAARAIGGISGGVGRAAGHGVGASERVVGGAAKAVGKISGGVGRAAGHVAGWAGQAIEKRKNNKRIREIEKGILKEKKKERAAAKASAREAEKKVAATVVTNKKLDATEKGVAKTEAKKEPKAEKKKFWKTALGASIAGVTKGVIAPILGVGGSLFGAATGGGRPIPGHAAPEERRQRIGRHPGRGREGGGGPRTPTKAIDEAKGAQDKMGKIFIGQMMASMMLPYASDYAAKQKEGTPQAAAAKAGEYALTAGQFAPFLMFIPHVGIAAAALTVLAAAAYGVVDGWDESAEELGERTKKDADSRRKTMAKQTEARQGIGQSVANLRQREKGTDAASIRTARDSVRKRLSGITDNEERKKLQGMIGGGSTTKEIMTELERSELKGSGARNRDAALSFLDKESYDNNYELGVVEKRDKVWNDSANSFAATIDDLNKTELKGFQDGLDDSSSQNKLLAKTFEEMRNAQMSGDEDAAERYGRKFEKEKLTDRSIDDAEKNLANLGMMDSSQARAAMESARSGESQEGLKKLIVAMREGNNRTMGGDFSESAEAAVGINRAFEQFNDELKFSEQMFKQYNSILNKQAKHQVNMWEKVSRASIDLSLEFVKGAHKIQENVDLFNIDFNQRLGSTGRYEAITQKFEVKREAVNTSSWLDQEALRATTDTSEKALRANKENDQKSLFRQYNQGARRTAVDQVFGGGENRNVELQAELKRKIARGEATPANVLSVIGEMTAERSGIETSTGVNSFELMRGQQKTLEKESEDLGLENAKNKGEFDKMVADPTSFLTSDSVVERRGKRMKAIGQLEIDSSVRGWDHSTFDGFGKGMDRDTYIDPATAGTKAEHKMNREDVSALYKETEEMWNKLQAEVKAKKRRPLPIGFRSLDFVRGKGETPRAKFDRESDRATWGDVEYSDVQGYATQGDFRSGNRGGYGPNGPAEYGPRGLTQNLNEPTVARDIAQVQNMNEWAREQLGWTGTQNNMYAKGSRKGAGEFNAKGERNIERATTLRDRNTEILAKIDANTAKSAKLEAEMPDPFGTKVTSMDQFRDITTERDRRLSGVTGDSGPGKMALGLERGQISTAAAMKELNNDYNRGQQNLHLEAKKQSYQLEIQRHLMEEQLRVEEEQTKKLAAMDRLGKLSSGGLTGTTNLTKIYHQANIRSEAEENINSYSRRTPGYEQSKVMVAESNRQIAAMTGLDELFSSDDKLTIAEQNAKNMATALRAGGAHDQARKVEDDWKKTEKLIKSGDVSGPALTENQKLNESIKELTASIRGGLQEAMEQEVQLAVPEEMIGAMEKVETALYYTANAAFSFKEDLDNISRIFSNVAGAKNEREALEPLLDLGSEWEEKKKAIEKKAVDNLGTVQERWKAGDNPDYRVAVPKERGDWNNDDNVNTLNVGGKSMTWEAYKKILEKEIADKESAALKALNEEYSTKATKASKGYRDTFGTPSIEDTWRDPNTKLPPHTLEEANRRLEEESRVDSQVEEARVMAERIRQGGTQLEPHQSFNVATGELVSPAFSPVHYPPDSDKVKFRDRQEHLAEEAGLKPQSRDEARTGRTTTPDAWKGGRVEANQPLPHGGSGADKLYGGQGDDVLHGGSKDPEKWARLQEAEKLAGGMSSKDLMMDYINPFGSGKGEAVKEALGPELFEEMKNMEGSDAEIRRALTEKYGPGKPKDPNVDTKTPARGGLKPTDFGAAWAKQTGDSIPALKEQTGKKLKEERDKLVQRISELKETIRNWSSPANPPKYSEMKLKEAEEMLAEVNAALKAGESTAKSPEVEKAETAMATLQGELGKIQGLKKKQKDYKTFLKEKHPDKAHLGGESELDRRLRLGGATQKKGQPGFGTGIGETYAEFEEWRANRGQKGTTGPRGFGGSTGSGDIREIGTPGGFSGGAGNIRGISAGGLSSGVGDLQSGRRYSGVGDLQSGRGYSGAGDLQSGRGYSGAGDLQSGRGYSGGAGEIRQILPLSTNTPPGDGTTAPAGTPDMAPLIQEIEKNKEAVGILTTAIEGLAQKGISNNFDGNVAVDIPGMLTSGETVKAIWEELSKKLEADLFASLTEAMDERLSGGLFT